MHHIPPLCHDPQPPSAQIPASGTWTSGPSHLGRNLCGQCCGWWGDRLCTRTNRRNTNRVWQTAVVDPGQGDPAGGRTTLPGRIANRGGHHPCECEQGHRCAVGDGRRAALWGFVRCDRGNLGGSACAGLHSHQATGAQGRSQHHPSLADATRHSPQPECGTRPVADQKPGKPGASARQPGTGAGTMASRPLSVTQANTRTMGGAS